MHPILPYVGVGKTLLPRCQLCLGACEAAICINDSACIGLMVR